jgi:hypothetical protein
MIITKVLDALKDGRAIRKSPTSVPRSKTEEEIKTIQSNRLKEGQS